MNEIEKLNTEYTELVERQQFNETDLDYRVLLHHTRFLDQLSVVGNSGITVYDFNKREHVYTSPNYASLFGYDLEKVKALGNDYFDSKVHPEDFLTLLRNGLTMMSFYYTLPEAMRMDYKIINEYRVQKQDGSYIRVIEQHQVLEQDNNGNIWLVLSVMDIAPNQDHSTRFKSQIVNFRNGEIVILKELQQKYEKQVLSERELAVLKLMKDGLLSKEISDLLSISVHTVNTHRQRILAKLNVSNTIEAINYAQHLGLIC